MRKYLVCFLLTLLFLFLMGCGQTAPEGSTGNTTGSRPESGQQQSEQEVSLLDIEWTEIESLAEGTEVRIFMWGGDEGINRYMDEWIAPRLLEEHGVTLTRTPMDTPEFMQKLMTEKNANKETGTIDIIWINGENFKNAKEHGLLWDSFSPVLPNYQAYVKQDNNVLFDFGEEVQGLEAPWGKVQFVYFYDSAKIDNPPQNFTELAAWVKENPGKFTYPEPNDFTGNAFLRHVLYDVVGVDNLLEKGYDEAYVYEHAGQMWAYLNELKPNLWRAGDTYPASLEQLDQLYNQGEVWLTMGYNEGRAESLIKQGIFPETTKSFVMEPGSIGNTHFLSIPFNSPNKAGAMVAINYLLSPEAQLTKMEAEYWGENMSLDPELLPAEAKQNLAELDRGASVLPAEELQQALLPEVHPDYVHWIKETWMSEVVQAK